MKNKLLGIGMLAGLLTLALVMFGCDHNPRPWDGEDGPVRDDSILGDWLYANKGGDGYSTLEIRATGEIKMGDEKFAFTASGGIIKVNMGQIYVGEYSLSDDPSGTLSITGIEDAPKELYRPWQ